MTILVTGATGSVGRLVVDHLLAAGATDVRALSNKPDKAKLPPEVEVVKGYLGKPETVIPALDGVDRMYLAPLVDTVEEVAGLAKRAGVRRIVDLSGEKESWWAEVSTAVEKTGLEWTHLCPGEFMDNALIWADQISATGQVRDGYSHSANAPIDLDDIAAVAALALLTDDHVGKEYVMTGPQSLTRADKVRLIGEALGKDVPYIELSHDDAVAELSKAMGEHAAWYVEGMAALAEHPQAVTPTVERILGRPAITFADWARRNVDKFR